MEEVIFVLNGERVPAERAVVPVTDRGFLYGDAVFETIHAYGPRPFRLGLHLDRLAHGMAALGFDPAPARADLERWTCAAIRAANCPETNVRLTVTRGTGPRGPAVRGTYRPNVVVMATPHHRRPESDYRDGVAAVVASFRRQEASAVANLKTTAYVEQVLARREADAAGADEALLLNNAGLLCEGSASNLTLVRAGALLVPDPRLCGALPGTAQMVAMELARKARIPVCETVLAKYHLRECDEAFLSGSLRELTPLVRVDGSPIGSGRPGPVTRGLIAAYRRLVKRECPGFRFPR